MLRAATLVLALALVPVAAADQSQDATVGLNLGVVAPGLWDIFAFHSPGGAVDVTLTWVEPALFPFADYDLQIYQPWANDDGDFDDHELVARSAHHPYAHHSERALVHLAQARYWIAVVPFQAQLEKYTLTTSTGALDFEESVFGYQNP